MASLRLTAVLGACCFSSAAGFFAAPLASGGAASARETLPTTAGTAAAAAATSTASAAAAPPVVSASVVSARKAVVALPPLDGDGAGYSVRWFEEDNPAIFDQATASLQSRLVLSDLSPGTEYVAVVRRTATAAAAAEAAAAGKAGDNAAGELRFSTPEAEGNASGEMMELSRLEIRVGRCLECSRHPDADSLYVETVDFGEGEPSKRVPPPRCMVPFDRTIVSGLVAYVPEDEMRGRMVVGLCNLPPRAMRGVTSSGMLLCASNDDHSSVNPLSPPEGAKIGELITFEGVLSAPAPPSSGASRAWSATMEDMKTEEATADGAGVAGWDGRPMLTSAGACTSSIAAGRVR
ncbi:unnamed protein product [Ectocarpus fasciculatus]